MAFAIRLRAMSLAVALMAIAVAPANAYHPESIVFGGDSNYPPFEYQGESGPAGFNVELEDLLGKVGTTHVRHQLGTWPDIVKALETGEVDVVPMFESEERERQFHLTVPFYYLYHVIYAAPGAERLSSVSQLSGRRVAVERMSYAHEKLETEQVEVVPVLRGDTLTALQAVANGMADFAILAALPADQLIADHGFELTRTGPPFWPSAYVFAVRKDRPQLADWLDENLKLAISTGRYEELFRRWQDRLAPTETPLEATLRWAAYILGPVLAVMVLALGWSWMLRRQVAIRTRQLDVALRHREAAEMKLREFADYDVHTGLPELHRAVELADDLFQTGRDDTRQEKEVVILKLAEIERIVRTFGYETAQHIVKEFAERLKRGGFDVCGYIGRGIFTVVAPKGAIDDHMDSLTAQMSARGLGLFPHLVGGSSYWPEHGSNASDLVRRAETALAVSIARGHNWATYDLTMEPDQEDLQIVTEFRRGNGADLHTVLQPQIDLRTDRVVAAEALVRWNHPEMGFISPAKFIPLLEEAGMITQVTARMIDEGARMGAALRRKGMACTISVNVAANDLLAADLLAIIESALSRHEGEPGDIKLELTETSVAEDPERVRAVLQTLADRGIHASIDDFGTGYSSLSYLSVFPIQELKVDQTFVRDMTSNPRNRSIIRSTIAMAHELGLIVVAEGAEDEQTIAALRQDGADRVQGYGIAKPMAENDLAEFLRLRVGSGQLHPY